MKLEEILKAQGLSDEDITALAPSLGDVKLRGTLEAAYGTLTGTIDSYKKENAGWADWHETHGKPTLALYEKDMTDAKAEAASLRERLRLAEANGFAPKRDDPNPNPNPSNPNPIVDPFDPKKHNLVTHDDVRKLADMEGQAITMAADLNEEYRYLTGGKSLIDYETNVDGRTVRGMTALRTEAIAAKQPLNQYVATKFDFDGKRKAIADAARLKAEEAIRADERGKIAAQYGNPESRPLVPSSQPFIPRREGVPGGGEAKQPWEIPAQDRRNARISNAMQSQMKGPVN